MRRKFKFVKIFMIKEIIKKKHEKTLFYKVKMRIY